MENGELNGLNAGKKVQQISVFTYQWELAYRIALEVFCWEVELVEASIFTNNRTFIGHLPMEEGLGQIQYCFRELNQQDQRDLNHITFLETHPQQFEFYQLSVEEFNELTHRCDLFMYRSQKSSAVYSSINPIVKSRQRIDVNLCGSLWNFFSH